MANPPVTKIVRPKKTLPSHIFTCPYPGQLLTIVIGATKPPNVTRFFGCFSVFPPALRIIPEFEQNGRFGFRPRTSGDINAALPDINHLEPESILATPHQSQNPYGSSLTHQPVPVKQIMGP
jgi:hypothetical protein